MFIPIKLFIRPQFTTVEIIEKCVINEKVSDSECIKFMLISALDIILKAKRFTGVPVYQPPTNFLKEKPPIVTFYLTFKTPDKMTEFLKSLRNY